MRRFNSVRVANSLDTHELAWAAGLYDGEGSMGCYSKKDRSGNYTTCLLLSIGQNTSNDDVLHRFKRAIGDLGRLDYFRGTTRLRVHSHENCQAIIALLWKFLSQRKKRQAVKAILEYRSTRSDFRIISRAG